VEPVARNPAPDAPPPQTRSKRSTEHLWHFCQRSGISGIYAIYEQVAEHLEVALDLIVVCVLLIMAGPIFIVFNTILNRILFIIGKLFVIGGLPAISLAYDRLMFMIGKLFVTGRLPAIFPSYGRSMFIVWGGRIMSGSYFLAYTHYISEDHIVM
jgi:hypothetical protein